MSSKKKPSFEGQCHTLNQSGFFFRLAFGEYNALYDRRNFSYRKIWATSEGSSELSADCLKKNLPVRAI